MNWSDRRWKALLLALFLAPWVTPVVADIEAARALILENRFTEAEAALSAGDDDVEARLLRGVIQSKQGKLDAATSTFEALASDYPELPQPLNNLAVLYAARGMTEQARSSLLRAVELQPSHANAHRNLGDLYLHMALDSYYRAQSLQPADRLVERKIKLLDEALGSVRVMPKSPQSATAGDEPETEPLQLSDARVAEQPSTSSGTLGDTEPPTVSIQRSFSAEDEPVSVASPLDSLTQAPDDAGCFAAGPFLTKSAADKAETWLTGNGGSVLERQRRRMPVKIIYQVYLEPVGSAESAKALLAEIKAKGVRDALVIRSGALQHGISLGAFNDEARARKHMAWLKRRGVNDSRFRTQQPDRNTIWLLTGVADGTSFDNGAFASTYPEKRRIIADCE